MAGGANHSRLVSITFPNGRVLDYNYASGLDDAISRLSSISDNSATLESYDYLGLGTVVKRGYAQTAFEMAAPGGRLRSSAARASITACRRGAIPWVLSKHCRAGNQD